MARAGFTGAVEFTQELQDRAAQVPEVRFSGKDSRPVSATRSASSGRFWFSMESARLEISRGSRPRRLSAAADLLRPRGLALEGLVALLQRLVDRSIEGLTGQRAGAAFEVACAFGARSAVLLAHADRAAGAVRGGWGDGHVSSIRAAWPRRGGMRSSPLRWRARRRCRAICPRCDRDLTSVRLSAPPRRVPCVPMRCGRGGLQGVICVRSARRGLSRIRPSCDAEIHRVRQKDSPDPNPSAARNSNRAPRSSDPPVGPVRPAET